MYVSDPWDFGREIGCGLFKVKVIRMRGPRQMLLRLGEPFQYKGLWPEYLVATTRVAGERFSWMLPWRDVGANFLMIDDRLAESDNPFDEKALRTLFCQRGMGVIGSVKRWR